MLELEFLSTVHGFRAAFESWGENGGRNQWKLEELRNFGSIRVVLIG